MEIKYKIDKDLFKFYNEIVEILGKRKVIEKSNNLHTNNYFVNITVKLIMFIIAFVALNLLFIKNNHEDFIFEIIWNIFGIIYLIFLGFSLVTFIIGYKNFTRENLNGTLTINKDCLIDKSNNTKIETPLDNITNVIIGKFSIIILTSNRNYYYFFPINKEKELLDALQQYKGNLNVIRVNNN